MNAVILQAVLSALLIQNVRSQAGGIFPAKLSEEDKNRLIGYSMEEFHKVSESPYHHKVVNVSDMTRQVVAGMIYRLKLELGETTCQKGQGSNDCNLRDPTKTKTCEFSVYERRWENFRETKVVSCN